MRAKGDMSGADGKNQLSPHIKGKNLYGLKIHRWSEKVRFEVANHRERIAVPIGGRSPKNLQSHRSWRGSRRPGPAQPGSEREERDGQS